jgi:hypothetical protein
MDDHERKIALLRADADKADAVVTAICTRLGVSEDEYAVARTARARPAAPVSVRSKDFNLGQFSSAGATAILAANATGKFLPDAGRDDFSDDRSNSPRDDSGETSESHRVGYASDLLNCAVSGEAGAGCTHGDIDHVAKAAECLRGAMDDDAMRKRNLADAGRAHTVRFSS